MTTFRLIPVGLLAVAALLSTGCASRDLEYKRIECEALKEQVADLEATLAKRDTEHVRTRLSGTSKGELKDAQDAIGEGGTVEQRDDGIAVVIESGILFRPGSAGISADAKSVLNRVVALIDQKYPKSRIRVEGHTDSDPIKRSKDKWDDNYDLGAGRAHEVLKYLLERKIPGARLYLASFADTKPAAAGAKAKNRRVEIVIER